MQKNIHIAFVVCAHSFYKFIEINMTEENRLLFSCLIQTTEAHVGLR